MKLLSTTSLIAKAICLIALLTGCGQTKTETVSAATMAQLPPGQSLEIDLTRKGTVYKFEDGTDASRVSIRTSSGVRPLADLLRESNTSSTSGLVLGATGDMRDHLPVSTGGTLGFDCGVVCKCDDTADCAGMIASGKCSDEIWCSSQTSACFCVAKQ